MELFTRRQTLSAIPGPKGKPLLGSLARMLKQDTLALLDEAQRDYGDFFKLKVGPLNLYVAAHPDYAQQILQMNVKNYIKGAVYEPGRVWMIRNGLVAANGDFWLKQRRMMQPQFHHQKISALSTVMTSSLQDTLEEWKTEADGRVIDLERELASLTMRTITRALFGDDYLTKREMKEVSQAFATLIKRITARLFLYFIPKTVPLPGDAQLRDSRRIIDEAIYKVIRQRRRSKASGHDLISLLISAVDDESNERMDDEQLRDEVVTLFLAGFDTTSTALVWTFYLLDQHPDVKRKLSAEISLNLGAKQPTMAELKHLPYARQVLQESMRLYSPVGMIPRTVHKADTLAGYTLPAGATVWLYLNGIHHHKDFWEEPEQFKPERFGADVFKKQHKFAYIPFIAGPRQCIGAEFAMMQSVYALVMIMQQFELELVSLTPIEAQLNTVLKPKGGMMARLSIRKPLYSDELIPTPRRAPNNNDGQGKSIKVD